MESQNKLIDQFHKNSSELIEVNISEWKCQKYVDIRIWYLPNPAEPGTQQATKKGICLSAELLPKLMKALEKAKKVLEKGLSVHRRDDLLIVNIRIRMKVLLTGVILKIQIKNKPLRVILSSDLKKDRVILWTK